MIRVTTNEAGPHPIVGIAGRLKAEHVGELEERCSQSAVSLVFDLTDLQGADAAALCWLRGRIERGDSIVGASPYVKLLLDRACKKAGECENLDR